MMHRPIHRWVLLMLACAGLMMPRLGIAPVVSASGATGAQMYASGAPKDSCCDSTDWSCCSCTCCGNDQTDAPRPTDEPASPCRDGTCECPAPCCSPAKVNLASPEHIISTSFDELPRIPVAIAPEHLCAREAHIDLLRPPKA